MKLILAILLFGKLIYGIAASVVIVASSLYLNETVPVEKSAVFDFTTNFGLGTHRFTATLAD